MHRGSISRSRAVYGPYESNPANPIAAAEHLNSSYVQTVDHAVGVVLAMSSGARFETYSMGRETVLFPVSWPAGGSVCSHVCSNPLED